MNRAKKEELKRYHEARKGLSPEEIVALDAHEAAETAIKREIEEMHLRLFPEEYDFIYDDGVDAKLRKQGINPMSAEYIARTDARRAALGFAGYMVENDSRPDDTMGWVRKMIIDGRRDELERICQSFGDIQAET